MDATNEIRAILQQSIDAKTIVNELEQQAKEIEKKSI